jgi:hypothetical protein
MTVAWCAGMYASGSTWAYNVMRAIAAAESARSVRARFANTMADLAGIDDTGVAHVVKTHDLPDDAAAFLLAQAPRIVVTIRDPRDAVASLMTYQNYPFALALSTIERSARFVTGIAERRPDALLLRYETGFPDEAATVAQIAAAIGMNADAATCARIFAEHRREQVERFIGALDAMPQAQRDTRSGDVFDPETQWHKHHAGRTGQVGRWQTTLQPLHVASVEHAMGPWMKRYDYAAPPAPAPSSYGYSVNLGNLPPRR